MCSKNKFFSIDWQQAAPKLSEILGTYFDDAKNNCLSGYEKIYQYNETVMLLRAEGDQLVIVALNGSLKDCASAIVERAKLLNFKSIRAHVSRLAMIKKLNQLGINFELVCEYFDHSTNKKMFEIKLNL